MSDLRAQLKKWPKIDLHRHLEGSIRLETLAEIAQEHGMDLPGYEAEAIRPHVQVTEGPYTHNRFLAKFRVLRRFYRTPEIVDRMAYEAIADAAEDNVRYLELRFTPSALASAGGFPLEDVVQWVIRAVYQAADDAGIQAGLIVSINRQDGLAIAEQSTDLAIKYKGKIVGLDLTGDEVAFAARPFGPLFQRAKQAGLGITVHAGEWKGSDNITESIEHLHADRIGHGVRAIEDVNVVRSLKERKITLEVCPTSNVQSGVVRSADLHPFRDLFDLGLSITLNTDDPSVSDITLTDEYVLAVEELGLPLASLKQAILNAAHAAFLPEEAKSDLVAWFRQALDACGTD